MTDRDTSLVSLFDVGRYAASCVTTIVVKEPLVYALWTAIVLLGGGIMLFLVTACRAPGLTV